MSIRIVPTVGGAYSTGGMNSMGGVAVATMGGTRATGGSMSTG